MAVITTGLHPKAVWPGVLAWFGRAYDEYAPQYVDLVDVETSDKAYEEEVESTGFGMASVKAQGSSIAYDSDSQGYTARYTNVTYGIGYMVTEEELEDNLYAEVSKRRAPDLAFALRQTKENVVANKMMNRAFNSSYPGGDGKELMATDHPTISGNQSNELANPADLSEAAIEDLVIQIRQATNARGLKIRLQPRSLHIPTDLEFEAHRILNSVLQNDTANNAVNVLKMTGAIPKIAVNQYFTSATAWAIRTNARHGAKLFQRRGVKVGKDNDFDTSNAKVKATERYVPGWSDWRCYYGTPGV